MANSLLVPLNSVDAQNSDLVGGKAATLARLMSKGFPIPPGFCVSTAAFEKFSHLATARDFILELEHHALKLFTSDSVQELIVRSSANIEDSPQHLFPGLFSSFHDVSHVQDVMPAVCSCFAAVSSPEVHNYCRLKSISHKMLKMAALVQVQLSARYSGVVFSSPVPNEDRKVGGTYVELVQGPSRNFLAGSEEPNAYLIDKQNVTRVSGASESIADVHAEVCRKVAQLFVDVSRELGEAHLLEWLSNDSGVYILQARPLPGLRTPRTCGARNYAASDTSPTVAIPKAEQLGLKAAAMAFYAELGWFTKPLVIIPPHVSEQDRNHTIMANDLGGGPLTIRFSHRHDVGLPRLFVANTDEAMGRISQVANPEWTVIIHPYLDIRHSFEIQIEHHRTVLEQVPGLWESDAQVAPDVVLEEGESCVAFRVTDRRKIRLVGPNVSHEAEVAPLPATVFPLWAEKLRHVATTIRSKLATQLPLNLHCVSEDYVTWQFLNLRRGRAVSSPVTGIQRFLVVTTPVDMQAWDGVSPILLRVTTHRGGENEILRLIPQLPGDPNMVYVEFGALSHPAILLREFGIDPIPLLRTHERILLRRE
jgi:hypothetical protein